jgi:ubiquinone biosynthesis monooxygenase Coq6
VWDGISDARITFAASELGLEPLEPREMRQMARLTENLNLQRALLSHLATVPEVQLLEKVKVNSIQREEREGGGGWPLVYLSDGRTLRTRLLVS